MNEYKYLAIDKDGEMYECKTEPFNNGLGRWFTKDFFGSDDSIRKIENVNYEDYLRIFDARPKKTLFDGA